LHTVKVSWEILQRNKTITPGKHIPLKTINTINYISTQDKNKSFTFPTLRPSRAPCKNFKNTPGSDYVFRTRLLKFSENTIRKHTLWNFVSFFDVKGLCWPLYDPHISCNAIAGFVWTVNNDHDTTDTPKSYLKN